MNNRFYSVLAWIALGSSMFLTSVVLLLLVFNAVMNLSDLVTTPLLIVLAVCAFNNISIAFLFRSINGKEK